jgi:hypothetical protein
MKRLEWNLEVNVVSHLLYVQNQDKKFPQLQQKQIIFKREILKVEDKKT